MVLELYLEVGIVLHLVTMGFLAAVKTGFYMVHLHSLLLDLISFVVGMLVVVVGIVENIVDLY